MKRALLIGVGEYLPEPQSGLVSLRAVPGDLQAMERVLTSDLGGFEPDQIEVLADPGSSVICQGMERLFADREKEDLLLLYFSGHGLVDERTGEFFLGAAETKRSLLRSTTVSAAFVYGLMSNSRSERQVVILDCCFSGAFAAGLRAKAATVAVDLAQQLGGRGRAILASSAATQYSFEDKAEQSIYTRFVVEGIETGAADQDRDGLITVDELHRYAKLKVQEVSPAMTPQIEALDEGFRIVVARARPEDPWVRYRQEVEQVVQQRQGQISRIVKRGLKRKQLELGVAEAEAARILDEVLQPYREFEQKIREYEQAVQEAIEDELTPAQMEADLAYLQEVLGLRDQDVAQIKARLPERSLPVGGSEEDQTDGVLLVPFEFKTATVNAQGEIIEERTGSAQGFTEDLEGVPLEMVGIPGGTFLMGSPESELERLDTEGPQHEVTVGPFFLGKFTITQAQWRVVAGWDLIDRELKLDPSSFKGEDHPVEYVSWFDAVEFCKRLSARLGKAYRLPSEPEWEYACRAGTTTPFCFGETITLDLVNYDGSQTYSSGPEGISRGQTISVGSLGYANRFGLYDTHGNVWEWCEDPWHETYQNAPTNGMIWEEGGDKELRLRRGGSWANLPRDCRSACRDLNFPNLRNFNIGFRVCCSPPRL